MTDLSDRDQLGGSYVTQATLVLRWRRLENGGVTLEQLWVEVGGPRRDWRPVKLVADDTDNDGGTIPIFSVIDGGKP